MWSSFFGLNNKNYTIKLGLDKWTLPWDSMYQTFVLPHRQWSCHLSCRKELPLEPAPSGQFLP